MEYERSHSDERRPVPRPPETAGIVSVEEAAGLLGISPSAVRKRIARGQLDARKVEGRWQIMLDSDALESVPAETSDGARTPYLTIDQLEAIRDDWLQPLLLQVGAQAELIGRLEARCRAAEEERDRLRAECRHLRARLDARAKHDATPTTKLGALKNTARQLRPAEGAVAAGIALAIAVWIGVGLLALLMWG